MLISTVAMERRAPRPGDHDSAILDVIVSPERADSGSVSLVVTGSGLAGNDTTDQRNCQSINIQTQSSVAKTSVCIVHTGRGFRSVVQQSGTASDGHSEKMMASTFVKSGAGGLVETVSTLQDTKTGVRQICFGRHIGDRLGKALDSHFTVDQDVSFGQLVHIVS